MTILGNLVPLVVLFLVLAIAAFIGYAVYTIATDIADKTSKKMEQKNVSFGKEGMKIGVKEIKTEHYVDQTQRYERSYILSSSR
jgi:predicted membrane protein